MKQPRSRIAQLIADRSLKSTTDKELSKEVAAYLLSEGRVNELDSLLRDVQLAWASDGYVEVIARSAHPINDQSLAEIKAIIKRRYPDAKEIIITTIDDPSVLGSVKLNVADQQLDLSIEAKLNNFKQLTAVGKD